MFAMDAPHFSEEQAIAIERFVAYEQMVDVVLDDTTRMQIPEKTISQELLDIPVSLESRIAHLVPYIEPTVIKLSASSIATQIGADEKWVARIAKRIGLEAEVSPQGEVYASPAFELIKEEWGWWKAYQDLDDRLSEYAISNFVAKSPQWVRKTAYDLEVYPENTEVAGRQRLTYAKTIIPQLRHILLVYMPSNGWYTETEIATFLNQGSTWVSNRLADIDSVSEQRSDATGRVREYYSPEVLETLQKLAQEKPKSAGEWRTLEGLSRDLNKSPHWVEARIMVEDREVSELRTDDTGKPAVHYSADVYLRLRAEALVAYPPVENYISINGLAKVLDVRNERIKRLIPETSFQAEKRQDKTGHVYDYYHPGIIDALRELLS